MPLKSNNINYYFIIRGGCNKKLLVLNNLQCHYYEYSNKRKSAARLGRLRLQGALAPANFILNLRFKMKKPCYFPVDFVFYRE